MSRVPKHEGRNVIQHYLSLIDLTEFRYAYPRSLSGGMQQKVAIARTLANDPQVVLMDEPFGSLDAQTRGKMQEFLVSLWEHHKKTVIFVTHDIEEAILLADRVIILSPRPAEIKDEFTVHLPRPRTHDLKFSENFLRLRKGVEQLL